MISDVPVQFGGNPAAAGDQSFRCIGVDALAVHAAIEIIPRVFEAVWVLVEPAPPEPRRCISG
ncbi:hypothetical protein D9M72_584190 [compost metagenome]